MVRELDEKDKLIKDMYSKEFTELELQIFSYTCKRLGLDPALRQIYPVKRRNYDLGKDVMTIQVGIDGYRLIAERTGKYAPGKAPEFTYDKDNNLLSATAFVKKLTEDGSWHEVSATAFFDEYASKRKDGSALFMWASKPHVMLSKCSEAQALRKAFPADYCGVYTAEEMQAEVDVVEEFGKGYVEEFIEKWSEKFDKQALTEYLQKRSDYTKESLVKTIEILSGNEKMFEKEFESWHNKHRTAS